MLAFAGVLDGAGAGCASAPSAVTPAPGARAATAAPSGVGAGKERDPAAGVNLRQEVERHAGETSQATPEPTAGIAPDTAPDAIDDVVRHPAAASSQATSRLEWLNPARCLAPCTFTPGRALRRLNDRGQPDPRGKHRVDATVEAPLAQLLAAARTAGHALRINSAFRSYQDQARVFRTTKERGRAARPGHSEHQLGTAVDLRLPTGDAIAWLAAHAHEHGFTLSYPAGKQRLTGYRPEPWHVRFVGRALADEVHGSGVTLEDLLRSHPERAESGSCADCPAAVSRTKCGAVTSGGRCDGTVLTWCYDGALAAVDCAVSAQSCGLPADSADHDCL
ncbi:MAG: M15 family metallopeptidase [Haliangium ochraceum]